MFTNEDLQNHKALKLIINKSTIELKGDAVAKVFELIKWYDDLGNKLALIKDAVEKKEKNNE